jgi:D-alanyl-lipoteichoic acid acyltransferase DltB (MBOAT superfamily)
MSFISYEFIAFISVLLLLYYLLPKKLQQPLLLVFSGAFFISSSGFLIIYILITILTTYLAGLYAHKKGIAAACVIFNLMLLIAVKYLGWLRFSGYLLPLGISFYTLQTAGYLIDVKREEYPPERNILRLALFAAFFPQLVQGPFNRYGDMAETLYKPHKFVGSEVSSGLRRMIWGYFKKLIVADRLSAAAAVLFADPSEHGGAYVLLGIIIYAVQLYADFTGGIDIALGLSRALGIRLAENFDKPFLAQSVKEYWRRWHISLGAWFRDYLFYPVSAWKPLRALSKKLKPALGKKAAAIPSYAATLIIWLCTGLWHGASMYYIVWGVLFGLIMVISEELAPLYKKFHSLTRADNTALWKAFRVLRTFCILGLVRTLECYRGVGVALKALAGLFAANNWAVIFSDTLGLTAADWLMAGAGTAVMIMSGLIPVKKRLDNSPPLLRYALTALAVLAILVFGAYGIGYNASDFIYGQF